LGGCIWSRIDGKSQVDYLSADRRDRARELARSLLVDRPRRWEEAQRLLEVRCQ
jgi:hypothetical protein